MRTLLIAILVAALDPLVVAQGDLFPGRLYAPSSGQALEMGDVTGDGIVDAVDQSSLGLEVLPGDGAGYFLAPIATAPGAALFDIALSDVNNDGSLDVLAGSAGNGSSLHSFLNLGGGVLAPPIVISLLPTTSTFAKLAVADFNLDGMPDVAASNGTARVLRGNGAGGFTIVSTSTLPQTSGIAAGDFDGDGFADVLTTTSNVGIAILPNIHGGGLAPPQIHSVGELARDVAAVDLDGNGFMDVLASHSQNFELTVLLASAPMTFQPMVHYPLVDTLGGGFRTIRIADFDANGILDVATMADFTNGALVRLGTGGGVLGAPAMLRTANLTMGGIGIADLDLDGDLDVTVSSGLSIAIYLAKPAGVFESAKTWFSGQGHSLVLGDFDGDSVADAAATDSALGLFVFVGAPGGGFPTPPTNLAVGVSPEDVEAADLDGDGHLDLAALGYNSSDVTIWLGSAAGTFTGGAKFTVKSPGSPSIFPQFMKVADFDLDGLLDVVTSNTKTNDLSWLRGAGAGAFLAPTFFPTGGNTPKEIDAKDFDHDGRPDVVVAHFNSADVALRLGAPGGFAPPVVLPTGMGAYCVAFADVTGDGFLDIVSASAVGLGVFAGNGQGGIAPLATHPLPLTPTCFAFADLDADGRTDILTGNSYDIGALRATPAGGFDVHRFASTKFPRAIAPHDLNGDGLADLVYFAEHLVTVLNTHPIPGGIAVFGTGTAGCQGKLAQTVSGPPKIGNGAFGLVFHHVPPNSLGICLAADALDFAGSDSLQLGFLLHLSLAGSNFLAAIDCPTGSGGNGFAAAAIPNNAFLIGATYFTQGIFLEPAGARCGPSPLGLISSPGLSLTIQQ